VRLPGTRPSIQETNHELLLAVQAQAPQLDRLEALLERIAVATERQAEAMEFLANRNTLGAP
jgi:hypothetical protein